MNVSSGTGDDSDDAKKVAKQLTGSSPGQVDVVSDGTRITSQNGVKMLGEVHGHITIVALLRGEPRRVYRSGGGHCRQWAWRQIAFEMVLQRKGDPTRSSVPGTGRFHIGIIIRMTDGR